MHICDTIQTNFYNLCGLPIATYDNDLKKLYSIGHTDAFEKIIKENNVLADFNLKNELFVHLKYKNDINFILTRISRFNKYRGYFLIGPFNSEKEKNFPFKNKECIKYLPNTLINISDDVFSKGFSNNKFNTYTRKAIYYVHKNYSKEIDTDSLCKELSINKSYFCKIFKNETGFTFSNFLNNYRVEKSKDLLLNTDFSMLDVAIAVGFNTQNYYSSVFKKFTDMTPVQFKNQNLVI